MIVKVSKIIQEGRALSHNVDQSDQNSYLVWGALPDEVLEVEKIKQKKNIIIAKITKIISPSPHRIDSKEEHYLSCSPLSIATIEYENYIKKELLKELFKSIIRENRFNNDLEFYSDKNVEGYRNKIEYNFWQTDPKNPSTLGYCFFRRESKKRIVIKQCRLANKDMNIVAADLLTHFKKHKYSSYNLKSIIIRKSDEGISASLFIKDKIDIITPELRNGLVNFEIHYSDHRAPVSRSDQLLLSLGINKVSSTLLGRKIHYSTMSFIQINLAIFQQVLLDIGQFIYSKLTKDYTIYDLYCGVGSIGLSLMLDKEQKIIFVDNLESNIKDLKDNINNFNLKNAEIIYLSDHKLDLNFNPKSLIILDPPRAGLSSNLVNKLLINRPEFIVYLSCNPITQKRDLDLFMEKSDYQVEFIKGYNFFPGTPHIENLIILSRS